MKGHSGDEVLVSCSVHDVMGFAECRFMRGFSSVTSSAAIYHRVSGDDGCKELVVGHVWLQSE